MFENVKIKALESKIKSMEKELNKALVKIELMKADLEVMDANKKTKSDRLEADFMYEDIGALAEYIKVLKVKIAFGKQKLENLKKDKYLDIDTDFNL